MTLRLLAFAAGCIALAALAAVSKLAYEAFAPSVPGFQRLRRRPGMADRCTVRAALGERTLRAASRVVRTTTATSDSTPLPELGVELGRCVRSRERLWASFEQSFMLLGPPRCGKGARMLIPTLLSFPGPAVVTSTRDDLFRHTGMCRPGPVFLFDPTEVCRWPHRASWSPLQGCDDPLIATLRARALVAGAGAGKNVTGGDFWRGSAEVVLRCYLHAAALANKDITTVQHWVGQQTSSEPEGILRSPGAPNGWTDDLSAQRRLPEQTRSSVFATVNLALSALADPRVVAACLPGEGGQHFDPERFVRDGGTLYLVGHSATQLSIAPLITALVESIVHAARNRAYATGGRLDPPLGLFLDEVAQIAPLPSLPSLVADGGGSGITTFTVLQSLAQARSRWGDAGAEALWDSSTVRMVFPGVANDRDLERISRLCGEVERVTRSRNHDADGRTSSSEHRQHRPVMTSADVRQLPDRHVLLLYRGLAPVESELPAWWERPRLAPMIRGSITQVEAGDPDVAHPPVTLSETVRLLQAELR